MFLAFIFLVFASPALAQESCEKANVSEVQSLHAAAQARKMKLDSMGAMYREEAREFLRKMYKIGRACPERGVYRQMVESLLSLGYPNQYLAQMIDFDKAGLALFRIGSDWDKTEFAPTDDPVLKKLHENVVIMGFNQSQTGLQLTSVGSGSYLGKFSGRHWVLTNYHVVKDNEKSLSPEEACAAFVYHMPSHGKFAYSGGGLVGAWPELDLAICSIAPSAEQESAFTQGLRFSFAPPVVNEPFVTMGFNSHNEKPGRPYFDKSEDCRLFLPDARLRDGRWSMAIGCDVASGDSGSPLVDRRTGKLRGVIWGTTEIKAAFTSAELRAFSLDKTKNELLWNELSQAVPAEKIGQALCAPGKEWNKEWCAEQH